MEIIISRFDRGLRLSVAPPYISAYLRYSHRTMEIVKYKKVSKFTTRLLYSTDDESTAIYTLPGFFEHLCKLIKKHGDTYKVEDYRTKMPEIDWQAVKDIGLRDYQVNPVSEALIKAYRNSGIFRATTGVGKTYCMMYFAAAFGLNTIVATPSRRTLIQTYKKFVECFPDKSIGIVGDGHKEIGQDITVSTFASLGHCATEKCELLLVDEIQKSTGDVIQQVLMDIAPIRMFGFTATDEGMFTGTDKLLKGMYGERMVDIPYDEAVEIGAVVPCKAYMISVPNHDYIDGRSFDTILSRGLKKYKERNNLIGRVVASVPEGWQTLTFVNHVKDHLAEVYKYMPSGTRYVHNGASKKTYGQLSMKPKEVKQTLEDYENAEFQHLIATDMLREGADFPNIRVVVQAGGGTSVIELEQEAGRGARILTPAVMEKLEVTDEKTHFVLIDFVDKQNDKLLKMSLTRADFYTSKGWEVHFIDKVEDIDWKTPPKKHDNNKQN